MIYYIVIMLKKSILKFLIFIFFIALLTIGWLGYNKFYGQAEKISIREDVMVERITNIGKLELLKYAMKDVIERKELRYFLPDQRILFIAVGEVTGCIDLTKVKEEDIVKYADDSITLYLPEPEVCYVKIDHKRSKVYDISGAWLPSDTQQLVEGIYKLAEEKLLRNAKEMDILGKTKENARILFKPMIEQITGVKVNIAFK